MPEGHLFHVFIERPRSPAPGAASQLAQAIAERYGIPVRDLEARLSAGRFRVKGNVDRATADTFATDLVRLGAVCTVVSVETPVPANAQPVTLQQGRVAPPAPAPRAPAPKPPAPAPAPAPAAPPKPARPAFAGPAPDSDGGLGALSGEQPMTLSMLDGDDDVSVDRSGNRPAGDFMPASFGPPPELASEPVAPPTRASSRDLAAPPTRASSRELTAPPPSAPVDAFAPPDAAIESELALEVEKPRKRQPSMASMASMASPPAAPAAAPVLAGESAASPAAPVGLTDRLRDPQARFVAGVVLAAIVGFVPATLIATVRQRSAFAELDGELQRRQNQVVSRDDWDRLDGVRASFLERKRAERQNIALTSLALWAAGAGGFAWFWFRKLDWDGLVGPPRR